MQNIIIPNFYTEKINEFILYLFKYYKNIDKFKYNLQDDYKNSENNSIYIADTFMKFLFENLNIKLEDFEYLYRKYVDNEHEDFECNEDENGYDDGVMIEYNFSKIISLYIYKKFVIYDNKNKFIEDIINMFDILKNNAYQKLTNISINNVDDIFEDIEEYKNTLILIKNLKLYVENDNIQYLNNIKLDLFFNLDGHDMLKDLLSIFNCINKFVEINFKELCEGLCSFFHRYHDDIIYKPIVEKDILKKTENTLKSDLNNNVNNDKSRTIIDFSKQENNSDYFERNENTKIIDLCVHKTDNGIKCSNKILADDKCKYHLQFYCDTCKNIKNSCICQINSDKNNIQKRNTKKETNQADEIKIVLDKIKKHYKKIYNDEDIYNQLIVENRQVIKTFSIIHQKYIENKINNKFINEIFKLYDTNKARFVKNIEIFHKIYNEKELYNSNYLFLKFTFNNINKESINNLINTLKSELLKN